MPISAARIVRPICATTDDLLLGRVTFQRARLAIFAVTVLTALGTINADAQIYLDLTHNAAQVESVCDSLSGVDGDARVQVDEVQHTLYDFHAIYAITAMRAGCCTSDWIRGYAKLPTLKIDLATRVLDDQMQVQLIHPGARYAFYDAVSQNSVLPVDLPFLNIPNGRAVPDADQISPMLERARVMRRWAKRPKSEARTLMPAQDLDHYRVGLNLGARAQGARTRLRNAAQKIFWDMPEGSLAVIPQKGITGN